MSLIINGKGAETKPILINPKPKIKAGYWECDQAYCFAADKKTVVLEGDARAAFLLYPAGEIIKVEDKAKYGLPLKAPKPPKATPPPTPTRRGIHTPGQRAPEADKAVTPGEPGVEVK